MTDMKCPVCQTVLEKPFMDDKICECPKCHNIGDVELWKLLSVETINRKVFADKAIQFEKELTRTRKALDVALDALKITMKISGEIDVYDNARETLIAIDKILFLDSGRFCKEPAEMWKIAKSAKPNVKNNINKVIKTE